MEEVIGFGLLALMVITVGLGIKKTVQTKESFI